MPQRPKVLFVMPQLYKGGAETALVNLLQALGPDTIEAHLLLVNQLRWPGVTSLTGHVPPWVRLHSVAEKRPHLVQLGLEALARVWEKLGGARPAFGAFRPLRGQQFDWAISYGEWTPPQWVARQVRATHKAAWMHADLDKAPYFDGETYFKWDACYERYLFASEDSRKSSEAAWPPLRGKSSCVHNVVDAASVRQQADQALLPQDDAVFARGLPVVLTCANVRPEKNHLRQIEAMALLKQRGVKFIWLNAGILQEGSTVVQQVHTAVQAAGLEDCFLLPGARENPFPLMRKADVLAVFSDFESWSLVITEALALGKPVLATRTSGAQAQLTDGVDGLLCDFSAEAMADTLERFLTDGALRQKLAAGAAAHSTQPPRGLAEFTALLRGELPVAPPPPPSGKKRILYLLDDANYPSGARNATALQAQALQDEFEVSVLALRQAGAEARARFVGLPFVEVPALRRADSLHHPLGQVLLGRGFSLKARFLKLRQAAAILTQRQDAFNLRLFGGPLLPVLEQYDIVVVASEASMFRPLAARLQKAKKVQWIHTDYARWKNISVWARRVTRRDAALYAHFDAVVTLSDNIRADFAALYPALAGRAHSIPNLVDEAGICEKAAAPCPQTDGLAPFNIITLGRMEAEKNLDGLLDAAARLAGGGQPFHWYLVGGGRLLPHVQKRVHALGLTGNVISTGPLENPYPLLAACDVMVLLSHYEGTPVTIDEAKVLGVPVMATRVGGIPGQVADGRTGLLLSPGDGLAARAAEALAGMMQHPQQLQTFRQNLATSPNHNADTLRKLEQLFTEI